MSLIATLATIDNPVADFSDTPWWLSLVKALFLFAFLMVNTLLVIWFERRVIGRMQQRPGPNRAGPLGRHAAATLRAGRIFGADRAGLRVR